MSIKTQIVSILMGTLVPYMCLNYAAYRWVVFRSYRSLEQTEADKDIARCMGALRSEIHHLSLLTNDWAAWDDTYRFVQDRNENYIK
jgi:sensor domain CHASE-containing protein